MKAVAEVVAEGETGTGGGVIMRPSVVVNMAILFDTAIFQGKNHTLTTVECLSDAFTVSSKEECA